MRLAVLAALALAVVPAAPRAASDAGASKDAPGASASPRAGAAAKPPAAATDLARALLTQEQWGKVLDSYSGSLAGQISQALTAKGEKVPTDLRGKLRAELEKTLPYQQTVDAQADALAKTLTPDELRRTAAFYGSPLGRKVLDKLPEAQSQVAEELQGRLSTAVPEIVNRVAPNAIAGHAGAGTGHPTGTGSSAETAPEPGAPSPR